MKGEKDIRPQSQQSRLLNLYLRHLLEIQWQVAVELERLEAPLIRPVYVEEATVYSEVFVCVFVLDDGCRVNY